MTSLSNTGFVLLLIMFSLVAELDAMSSIKLTRSGHKIEKKQEALMKRAKRTSFLAMDTVLQEESQSKVEEPIIQKNSNYFGEISLGNPAQKFLMLFDTGSSNILIPTTECETYACKKHSLYSMQRSKTGARTDQITNENDQQTGSEVTIQFGTGSVEGKFYRDDVCIKDLCIKNQTFVGIYKESDEPFDKLEFDGIFGLAKPAAAVQSAFSFLYNLNQTRDEAAEQKKRAVFSFFLQKDDDDFESELIIGGIKDLYFSSNNLKTFSVSNPNFWGVKLSSLKVGVKDMHVCEKQEGCEAIFDSGTSMISAPMETLDLVLNEIGVKEDCSNLNDLPNLIFQIENDSLELEPSFYVKKLNLDGNLACVPLLMPIDTLDDFKKTTFILGEPFLRKYYTIYDLEKNTVSVSPSFHRSQLEPQ